MLLGEGSFGYVYKVKEIKTNEVYAVKIIPLIGADIQKSIKEIEILAKYQYQYIVKYHKAFLYEDHLWLIMEYC